MGGSIPLNPCTGTTTGYIDYGQRNTVHRNACTARYQLRHMDAKDLHHLGYSGE